MHYTKEQMERPGAYFTPSRMRDDWLKMDAEVERLKGDGGTGSCCGCGKIIDHAAGFEHIKQCPDHPFSTLRDAAAVVIDDWRESIDTGGKVCRESIENLRIAAGLKGPPIDAAEHEDADLESARREEDELY